MDSAKAQRLPQHEFLENAKKLVMAGLCETVLSGREAWRSGGTGSGRSFCVLCCASSTLSQKLVTTTFNRCIHDLG